MAWIVRIEDALKDRLLADIPGLARLERTVRKPDESVVQVPVKVESYPRKPSEQVLKTLAAAGAVLTRYAGSKYGPSRVAGTYWVQDRDMFFEVLCVADSLRALDAAEGTYELIDLCGDRLIGHIPDGAVDGIELVQDDYLSERNGAWEYGLYIKVKTQKVRHGD